MHILVVPTGIYPLPRAPLECIFEQQQAEALQGEGLHVTVLSGGVITARHLGRPFPYEKVSIRNGVTVLRSHRRAYWPARWESPFMAAKKTYRRLAPILADYISVRGRPQVVHAHNLASGGLIARRILMDFGIPYVVTEHTGKYARSPSAVQHDADALGQAAASAASVIAVSSQLAANLGSALPMTSSQIRVVPNVVTEDLLRTEPAPRQARPFTVLGVGNLVPGKNYQMLIRSFASANLPYDSQLLLGGAGPEDKRLRALAEALGLRDRVGFLGELDRDGFKHALRRADLFAHPSDSESFGVVLIEALAVGLPVLATSSGGPDEIVTSDVGILTPVGDMGAFAHGLTTMYQRREDFHAEYLKATCRRRFGPSAFAATMRGVYEDAESLPGRG